MREELWIKLTISTPFEGVGLETTTPIDPEYPEMNERDRKLAIIECLSHLLAGISVACMMLQEPLVREKLQE